MKLVIQIILSEKNDVYKIVSKKIYIIILLLIGCESNTFSSLEEDSVDPNSYFSHNISSKVAFYFLNLLKLVKIIYPQTIGLELLKGKYV